MMDFLKLDYQSDQKRTEVQTKCWVMLKEQIKLVTNEERHFLEKDSFPQVGCKVRVLVQEIHFPK